MSNRRKIRETVLQGVYASHLGGHSHEHILKTVIKPALMDNDSGLVFAERLFLRSLDFQSEADKIIQKHMANWKIDRLAILDRLILEMAITELVSFDDIPTKVTINEAIELAKKFSTEKSGQFVNGILDAVLLTLTHENRLSKSGRGLVDYPVRKPLSNNKSESSFHPMDSDKRTEARDDSSQSMNHNEKKRTAKKKRIKRSKNTL